MWVMVRVREPTVTCADPVTANTEFLPTVVLVDKNRALLANSVVSSVKKLLAELVLMVPRNVAVLEPDRVQVVFPEPRTPSTLTAP